MYVWNFSFTASQDDVNVFKKISKAPGLSTPHAYRWYTHMKSFTNEELKEFPAGNGGCGDVTSTNPTTNGKAQDDADDVDLFASDEEEVSRISIFISFTRKLT